MLIAWWEVNEVVIDKGGSRAQGNDDKGYYGYSWGHCILIYNGIRVPSGYLEKNCHLSSRVPAQYLLQ